MTTRTVPTGTTFPSSTRICVTLPAAGEGISTSGSSSATSWPSATSQRATSPSVSPSPRSGSFSSYATGASLEDARPDGVVRLDRGLRRGRRRELVAEERVDDDVTQLRVVQASAQRGLLAVAELARDRPAALVRGIAADFDALDVRQLEGGACQRRDRLRAEAVAGPRSADPVADLERLGPDPRVQAGPAHDLVLVAAEDAVGEVLAEVELAAELAQERDLVGERLRLVRRPRHPREQVVDAAVDGVLE